MKKKIFRLLMLTGLFIFMLHLSACNHKHDFQDFTIIKEATCEETGIKEYKCKKCSETKQLVIDKLPHDFVEGVCSVCYVNQKTPLVVTIDMEEFTLSDDGTYYILTGLHDIPSTKKIGKMIVPDQYNGLPIKEIDSNVFGLIDREIDISIPKTMNRVDTGFSYYIYPRRLGKVFYRGTLEDWCTNVCFKEGESNYVRLSDKFLLLDEKNNFYEPTEITISGNIKEIGDYQFYYMRGLKKVTISEGVTSIGENAFKYCDKLETVEISKSVKRFAAYAFSSWIENCYYRGTLEDWCQIDFGDGCSNPMNHFENFYMLDETNQNIILTDIAIPNNITSIGEDQFSGLKSLTNVVIPNTVTKIGFGAFSNCENLKKVIISSSIEEIGSFAFYNCENLEEVIFDGNCLVSTINNNTFEGCYNINKLVLSNNIIKIEEEVFAGKIESVYYDGTLEDWCNITFVDGYANPLNSAKHFYIKDNNDKYIEVIDLIIPQTVTSIGEYQFYGFTGEKVVVSSGVKEVCPYAFASWINLKTIEIGNTVENIQENAFKYSKSLEHLTFEENSQLKNIGASAFENGSIIEKLELPEGLESIGNHAFGYTAIKNLVLPKSIKTINNAFARFSGFETLYYNGTLEDWCNITFTNSFDNPMQYVKHFYLKDKYNKYYELIEIRIPSTITHIKSYTFMGLTTVRKVVIPETVITIDMYAFFDIKWAKFYCKVDKRPSGWDPSWTNCVFEIKWGY